MAGLAGAYRVKIGVLFMTYTGLLEPLGQSQVLAYQERLAADHRVHIVSFEQAEDLADVAKVAAVRKRVEEAGVVWHPLRYHKRWSLLSTAWDIAVGTWTGWRIARRERIDIVHARSYVPAAMGVLLKRLTAAKLLFDMRGFWVDERVDGGLWPRNGFLYRVGKWFEQAFLIHADHIISLTRAAASEIQSFEFLQDRTPEISVIPTCADLIRFAPCSSIDKGRFILGYVGSAGTWYKFDAAVEAFKQCRKHRPDALFRILNRGSHDYIRQRLAALDVDMSCVELRGAEHSEVPSLMAAMDAGVFFYKPSYSRVACAPTKLGEFLGCGVPCLSNEGVGDMAAILREDHCGVAISGFDASEIAAGIDALLALVADPGTRDRCVQAAARHFSLEEGVRRYRGVYRALAEGQA